MISVCLISLGCPKNLVDSETILGALAAAGYVITAPVEDAEIIIINTCAFIMPAVREALDEIFYCTGLKKKGSCRCLIVTGCLTQRYGAQLARLIPEVDAWFGVNAAAELLYYLGKTPVAGTIYPRMLATPPFYAYLKIAEGCAHNCAYCLIPKIRGPLTSKPLGDIYREAIQLVEGGVREIILVAQDTGSYGRDLAEKPSLAMVLKELAGIPELKWIRLLYLSPASITPELIETIRSESKICHYLDLPLQHANRNVLRRMGRIGVAETYLELITELRSCIPDLVVRTTLLTGFPGEDQQAFQELLDFVAEAEFDRLGVFPYYHEEGSRSFRYGETVSYFQKRKRRRRIMQLQRGISRKKNEAFLGMVLSVLIERSLGNGVCLGRSYREAPEIDPKIVVRGDGLVPGSFVNVRITQACTFDLAGVVAGDH